MPVRLAQYAFTGGEIAPKLEGRTDLEKYGYSLHTAKNVLIDKAGGVKNRPGTIFVGEVKDSTRTTRVIPFQFSTTQAYVLEFGHQIMRPIMDGGQILRTATNITGISSAASAVITSVAHGASAGERVYITGVTGVALSGVSQVNARVFIVATTPTANTMTVTDLYATAFNTTTYTAYSSGGTLSRLYDLASPYGQTEVFDVGYAQTADTMYMTHMGYAVRSLTRSGHAAWAFSTVTFGSSQAAPTNQLATPSAVDVTTTYSYKITAIDDDTGQESLPTAAASCTNDLTVAGRYNTITWTAASGAERYIVYKNDNGIYGFIGGTTGTSFIDDNIAADLGDTPPASRNPFSSSSNYPAVCEFHEGRLWFAQTINTPGGVWSSMSNLYVNLNVSAPAKADDAVTFQLRPGVNAVKGLASVKSLVALTSDAEFTIDGGGVTSYITPASLVVHPHTRRGSSSLRPLIVGDIVLYTQRQGAVVRAFGYSFEKDGFRGNDLTLLAPHLFRGRSIVDWCYQQDPDSVVWCVLDNGVILALTFVEEQNVFAWTKHYLGGAFGSTAYGIAESCCSIEGSEQDDVYFVVKRTINGGTKRYIERLDRRWDGDSENIDQAYFVDCGISYTSTASAAITGLHHLEGQAVACLSDGDVVEDLTVSNGQVTLPRAATPVHLGLAYESDIVTLPVTEGDRRGIPQGRVKGITSVTLKLAHSRGVKVGQHKTSGSYETNELQELRQRHLEAWSDPMAPYSGDTKGISVTGGWGLNGRIIARQSYALPLEVLMVARDVDLGGL